MIDLAKLADEQKLHIERISAEALDTEFDFSPLATTARDMAYGFRTAVSLRNDVIGALARGARTAQLLGLDIDEAGGYMAACRIVAEVFNEMGLNPGSPVDEAAERSEEVTTA